MKKLAIMGSTGSVGTQSLEIVQRFPEKYKVSILAAGQNAALLEKQIHQFNPELVLIHDTIAHQKIKSLFENQAVEIRLFNDEIDLPLEEYNVDLVINALSSVFGFKTSYATLKKGINLALANKESILLAGDLLVEAAKSTKAKIIPIDSEASAIFQCLQGENSNEVEKIFLTASGGPLYKKDKNNVTKIDVLNHPVWSMGAKISVDSATMMNKAFELYEIHKLFGFELSQIEVIIHPESFIHSMVQFHDGQIKALISEPNMTYPIAHAMSYPERHYSDNKSKDIFHSNWNFEPLKPGQYPCFDTAISFLEKGGSYPAALVVVNDYFVHAFLNEEISFEQINPSIQAVMNGIENRNISSLDQIGKYVKECEEMCIKLAKS